MEVGEICEELEDRQEKQTYVHSHDCSFRQYLRCTALTKGARRRSVGWEAYSQCELLCPSQFQHEAEEPEADDFRKCLYDVLR